MILQNYSSLFAENRFEKCESLKKLHGLKVSTQNLILIAYAVHMIVMSLQIFILIYL
jgi:hypothetical protein